MKKPPAALSLRLKLSSTLFFACPVLDNLVRSTHWIQSSGAQSTGYSGTSGLLLGLSSIASIRGELVLLLRRYFNSLYPLASAWLRNLAAKLPGLHFNT